MKKFFEPALAIGLAISLVIGARADAMQKDISDQMLRLHVIANSNSDADQAEKLHIRDLVLSKANELLKGTQSVDEVKSLISTNLDTLIACAERGTSRPIRAQLTTMYFPTRHYDTFTLPAGEYEALRIIIGEGNGRNWWCVMFPPLCVSAADAIAVAEDAGLSDEEVALISKGENVYRYEFKFLEILSKIKDALF